MAGPRLAAAAAGRNGGKRKGTQKENATQIQHQLAEFFNAGSQWHLSILLQVLWQKSETLYKTDGKEFGGWKIPKASNNNRCAPGGRNWEIDGWRKNRRFSSRALEPHRTGHNMRPGKRHSIPRAFADSNRPDKRSKQKQLRSLETIPRGSDKCRRLENQKLKRSDTILTSDLLGAGEPAARRRRRGEPSPIRFGGRAPVVKAGGSDRAAAGEGGGRRRDDGRATTGLAVPRESIRGEELLFPRRRGVG